MLTTTGAAQAPGNTMLVYDEQLGRWVDCVDSREQLPSSTMHYGEQLGRWGHCASSDSFRLVPSERLATRLDVHSSDWECAQTRDLNMQHSSQRRKRWSCGPSGCQIGCINLYSAQMGYCRGCELPRLSGASPAPLVQAPFPSPALAPTPSALQDTTPSASGASSAASAPPVVIATSVGVDADLRAELQQAADAIASVQQRLVTALQRTKVASVTQR